MLPAVSFLLRNWYLIPAEKTEPETWPARCGGSHEAGAADSCPAPKMHVLEGLYIDPVDRSCLFIPREGKGQILKTGTESLQLEGGIAEDARGG